MDTIRLIYLSMRHLYLVDCLSLYVICLFLGGEDLSRPSPVSSLGGAVYLVALILLEIAP